MKVNRQVPNVCKYCVNHLNPLPEKFSSNKKLKHSIDTCIILWETTLGTELGYSILHPYRGVDIKFQEFTEIVEFHGP